MQQADGSDAVGTDAILNAGGDLALDPDQEDHGDQRDAADQQDADQERDKLRQASIGAGIRHQFAQACTEFVHSVLRLASAHRYFQSSAFFFQA